MDKFGVFRLLNSFLDFYKNNQPQNDNGVKSGIFDLFSTLSGKNFTDKTANGKSQDGKTQIARPPIVNPMLKIMQDHDAAVKRIKKERP